MFKNLEGETRKKRQTSIKLICLFLQVHRSGLFSNLQY